MIESTQYPYSLKFSIGALLVMIILMLIPLRNVWEDHAAFVWMIYGFCSLVFISLGGVIITKRLIPALKGDTALLLDEEGLSDFIKEVSIAWKDIKEIHLVRSGSASIMRIDMKWESNYGSQIAIYLRWINGKDAEIYETTMAYFNHCTSESPNEP